MPSITGINLVKSIQQNIMVIFSTAFSEYAAVSYDLNAIDYLLKPINQKRFTQAINKAFEYHSCLGKKHDGANKNIFVRAEFSLLKIPIEDIQYIEGLADYVRIYVRNRKTIKARIPMKEIMEKLPAADFIRVHRSFILPFSKIEAVRGTTIFIGAKNFLLAKPTPMNFSSAILHKSHFGLSCNAGRPFTFFA